jgi:hypothetical protein
LFGEEAAKAMRLRPTRCPFDVVLETPYDADPQYHQDWTIVKGSNYNPKAWAREKQLRDQRDILIRESLTEGKSVFYKSSGNSMWPLVQSGDACRFHPIQAVTANDAPIQKKASKIDVGDIVFCKVEEQFFAHIVQKAERSLHPEPGRKYRTKFCIGNIQGHINGWCYRKDIFGILVDVKFPKVKRSGEQQYFSRPFPKEIFEKVSLLVKDDRWNKVASELCIPPRLVKDRLKQQS